MGNGQSANGKDQTIVLTTRVDGDNKEAGEDRYNENTVKRADVFFFNDDQTGECIYAQTGLQADEENKLNVTLDYDIIHEGSSYYIYVIANHDFGYTNDTAKGKTLAELKADGTIDQINANFIPTSELKGTCPYVSPEGIERPNGKLVVATNAEFPPYEYWESGKITGIDMQIMQAICDKLGYEMKIEDMAFDSIIAAVSSGKADVGAAGMSVTEDRMKNVDFSDPYTTAQQVIIVKKPVTSTTEPGEATPTKAPAPVLGILAGLGAAVVLLRKF